MTVKFIESPFSMPITVHCEPNFRIFQVKKNLNSTVKGRPKLISEIAMNHEWCQKVNLSEINTIWSASSGLDIFPVLQL